MPDLEVLIKAALIGIGGTLVLDVYAWVLVHYFKVPMTNWAMVGRWIGLMPRGQFLQPQLGHARKVRGESAIGWGFHYAIGAGYGLLLVAIWGTGWILDPTIVEPILLALALLALPFFMMMPGMGMGIAASRTSKPNVARLKSFAGHLVFGCGMYLAAFLNASLFL